MIDTTSEEFKLAHEGVVGPDPPGDTARDPMVVMLPAWTQDIVDNAKALGYKELVIKVNNLRRNAASDRIARIFEQGLTNIVNEEETEDVSTPRYFATKNEKLLARQASGTICPPCPSPRADDP